MGQSAPDLLKNKVVLDLLSFTFSVLVNLFHAAKVEC